MFAMNAVTQNSNEIHENWGNIIDVAVREKPVFVTGTHDNIIIMSTQMFQEFFEPLKLTLSILPEEDGSFTGTVEELDLIENAHSKEECIKSLIEAMKDYAQDFYNEFNFWSAAPNRKAHVPYVLKILSSTDEQLKRSVICRSGKN